MRTTVAALSLLLACSVAYAEDKSPTKPQSLSVPITVNQPDTTLPTQVPNYLDKGAGWEAAEPRTGNILIRAASKTGLWDLTLNAKARLTTYVQKRGGLAVKVLAIQTNKDVFTDVSVVYGDEDAVLQEDASLQFGIRDNGAWYLSKSPLGPDDQPSLENNVTLFPDKLDEAARTVTIIARTVIADGSTKEVRIPLN